MAFKQGTTPLLIYTIDDLDVSTVEEVIFTITSEAGKALDPITVEHPETNTFMIGLTQEQTMQLQGSSQLEAQINFKDKHQEKTVLDYFYVNDTLGTKVVEGNKPASEGSVERILERLKGDVAWIVTPEDSEELLEAVTGIFNATKEVADSVRQDADAGVFDGEDGFSPQVTVKTETPSTYVLHIKDADHEYDTPNLKGGGGGGGDYSAGNGIEIIGNIIKVKLGDSGFLLFDNNGNLVVDYSALSYDSNFRQKLANPSEPNALASLSWVTEKLGEKQNVIDTDNKLNADLITTEGTTNQFLPVGGSNGKFLGFGTRPQWVDINADIVDDSESTNKFVTENEKQTWNAKQDAVSGGNGINILNNIISIALRQVEGFLTFTTDGKLQVDYSELAKNSSFRTLLTDVNYFFPLASKQYVNDLIATTTKMQFVSQLPTQNIDTHTIYCVPKQIAQTNNIYDEWVYAIKSTNPDVYDWELIGSTEIDLSNYYTKSQVDNKFIKTVSASVSVGSSSSAQFIDVRNYDTFIATSTLVLDQKSGLMLATYDSSGTQISEQQIYDSTSHEPKLIDISSASKIKIYTFAPLTFTLDYNLTSTVAFKSDLNTKQDTIDTTHKLDADNVDDTNSTNKFVTSTEKSTWNGKADNTTITTDTSTTTVSLTLADNHEYRYTQDLTSLTLTMPNGDFIASVVFASGSTPTSMTYDSSIKWSGDDVTNGQFVPTEKTYNVIMWYDGININGVVRGV